MFLVRLKGGFKMQVLRLDEQLKKAKEKNQEIKYKFDDAIEIIKDFYMFMYEDENYYFFKHQLTKEYIKIQKDIGNNLFV